MRFIDALDELCAQLMRDLFAIAKFLYSLFHLLMVEYPNSGNDKH